MGWDGWTGWNGFTKKVAAADVMTSVPSFSAFRKSGLEKRREAQKTPIHLPSSRADLQTCICTSTGTDTCTTAVLIVRALSHCRL